MILGRYRLGEFPRKILSLRTDGEVKHAGLWDLGQDCSPSEPGHWVDVRVTAISIPILLSKTAHGVIDIVNKGVDADLANISATA